MKTDVLSVILTFVNFVLIHGIDSTNSTNNPATNSTRRLLFGKPAAPSDFPYLVKLDIKGSVGGGSIIADQWVLTAAHVPYNQECTVIIINPIPWNNERNMNAIECYPHPQYTNWSNAYDIGLLKVEGGLIQDGGAQAIPLPTPGMYFPVDAPAVIAGSGLTEDNNPPDQVLWAEVRVKDWNLCNHVYLDGQCDGIPRCIQRNLPRRILCTQGEGPSPPGVCFGDSGSPVVVDGAVAGVVSFSIARTGKCNPGVPSMHTTVVDYLPWIYSHMDPNMDTSSMPVRPED